MLTSAEAEVSFSVKYYIHGNSVCLRLVRNLHLLLGAKISSELTSISEDINWMVKLV